MDAATAFVGNVSGYTKETTELGRQQMVRLLRPYIPIPVRLLVIERQITFAKKSTIVFEDQTKRQQLDGLISFLFGADKVHLDHDPPLAARAKVFWKGVHVDYRPAANDPEYLIYREAAAHRLKTNVRGDGAQHPDRVLIKKARRLERGPKPKRGPKMQGRSFIKSTNKLTAKVKWAKRPFPKRRKP